MSANCSHTWQAPVHAKSSVTVNETYLCVQHIVILAPDLAGLTPALVSKVSESVGACMSSACWCNANFVLVSFELHHIWLIDDVSCCNACTLICINDLPCIAIIAGFLWSQSQKETWRACVSGMCSWHCCLLSQLVIEMQHVTFTRVLIAVELYAVHFASGVKTRLRLQQHDLCNLCSHCTLMRIWCNTHTVHGDLVQASQYDATSTNDDKKRKIDNHDQGDLAMQQTSWTHSRLACSTPALSPSQYWNCISRMKPCALACVALI